MTRPEHMSSVQKSHLFNSYSNYFCNKLFESFENYHIKQFFQSPNDETMPSFKCITDLWYVMWVRLSFKCKTEASTSCLMIKKILKFCAVWYHINSIVDCETSFFSDVWGKFNKYAYSSKSLPMMWIFLINFILNKNLY